MLNKLFLNKTDNFFLQFFRYIFVGGTSFLIHFFSFYIFTNICGIYYLISGILAFLIAVIVNYLLSTKWVFNQYNIENRVIEFNLFLIISMIGLVINEIVLYIFTDLVGVNHLISLIIAACVAWLWNFVARRRLFYGESFIKL